MRTSCILIFISLLIYISIAEISQSSTDVEKDSNNVLLERNVRTPGKNRELKKKNKNKGKVYRKKNNAKNNRSKKKKGKQVKNKNNRKEIKNAKKKNKKNNKRKNPKKTSKKKSLGKRNKKETKKRTNNNKNKQKNRQNKGKNNGNRKKIKRNKPKKKAKNVAKKESKQKAKKSNEKTKLKSKLKRNKVKDNNENQNKPTEVEARQSSTDCEATMCSMAKKFNLYQNQYRKANRIESWVSLTANKKTKAATTFSNSSTAIQESTNNGTGCGQGTINDEAKTANTKLSTCSTTATALCESSAEVNSSSTTLLSTCKPLLKTFIDGYKACLKDCSTACSCMEALTLVDDSCTKFNDLETAMKARKDNCIKSSSDGSFGDCRKQERHTAHYSNLCKTSSCTVTTMAPSGRKKYLRDLMLKKNLK